MRLKYYLRGLGIGVIITTIILAFVLEKKPQALTDAQIKARAKELGMVEEELISKDTPTASAVGAQDNEAQGASGQQPDATEPATAAPTTAVPTTAAPTTAAPATEPVTTKPPETTAPPVTEAPQANNGAESGEYVTIEIGPSDWSNHVAQKLEAAGLVQSASDFDQYLIKHGYESIITSGTHRFKLGYTYAELANELVSKPR